LAVGDFEKVEIEKLWNLMSKFGLLGLKAANREIKTLEPIDAAAWLRFCASPPETFVMKNRNNVKLNLDLPAGIEKVVIRTDKIAGNLRLPKGVTHFECWSGGDLDELILPESLVSLKFNLNSFPKLPVGLKKLWTDRDDRHGLWYPPGLEMLICNCDGGEFHDLRKLPKTLKYFQCESMFGSNKFGDLSQMPEGIEFIDIYSGILDRIEVLPSSLIYLELRSCSGLFRIPELPRNLQYLILDHCRDLDELPRLPEGLLYLNINSTEVSSIGNLPESLVKLNCGDCPVEKLPKLPDGLKILRCGNSGLGGTLEVPNGIRYLNFAGTNVDRLICEGGKLTEVGWLYCQNSLISSLPELPEYMDTIDVSDCQNLVKLPYVRGVKNLYCHDCEFRAFPMIEDIEFIQYDDDLVQCLPEGALGAENLRISVVPGDEEAEIPSLLELAGATVASDGGMMARVEIAELREYLTEFKRCRGCEKMAILREKMAKSSDGTDIKYHRCWRCVLDSEWRGREIPCGKKPASLCVHLSDNFEIPPNNYKKWFALRKA
jgi:hypothetical protein